MGAVARKTCRMTSLLGFIEGPDLLVVLAIVLVLFGGSKLHQLARSLGQAKKELDAGLREEPLASTRRRSRRSRRPSDSQGKPLTRPEAPEVGSGLASGDQQSPCFERPTRTVWPLARATM